MVHRIVRVNGQRIAWANTSLLPADEIVAALRFMAGEVNLDRTVFHFKRMGPRRRTYGRAYNGIPGIANLDGLDLDEWRYLAVVAVHTNWFETLAHEAKHVEQFKRRERVSEVQARAFAAWAVEKGRVADE